MQLCCLMRFCGGYSFHWIFRYNERQPGQDIAIFGAGSVGLCAVACAKLFTPGRIILVDQDENRLEMGRRLGATHILNIKKVATGKEIKTITRRGVDVALDAAGLRSTMEDCIQVTAVGGSISNLAVGKPLFEVNCGTMFTKNLSFKTGLVNLTKMETLMKLIELEKLDVSPIITHELPLDDIIEGYRIFANRGDNCIKVMIKP